MRSGRLILAAALVAGTMGAAGGTPARATAGPARPNVLLIVTDDQRGGLQVMPRTRRWIFERGTRYDNAYVAIPLCCPSRASIMTGLYAHNHRVLNHDPTRIDNLDHRETLQYHLQNAGYTTGIVGKYLNTWDIDRDPPYFDSWTYFNHSKSSYNRGLWNDDGDVAVRGQWRDLMQRRALAFIEDATERPDPWLLYLTPPAPHDPYIPERRFRRAEIPSWRGNRATREKDLSDKPRYVRKRQIPFREGRAIRRHQFRTLMSVDLLVDAVMAKIDELGELEDTLVVFTSDNGYLWGDHGIRGKTVPYLPSIEVPFGVAWPARFAPGMRDPRLVSNIDIAPTVLEATGQLQEMADKDGESLLAPRVRDRLLVEYFADDAFNTPTWAATITHDHQYVEYYRGDRVVAREYYDLLADPWQLRNLLRDGDDSNDPPVPALSARLAADRQCRGPSCP